MLSKVLGRSAVMVPLAKAEAAAPGRPRTLAEAVRDKSRAGYYSRRTEEAYLGWVRRFIRLHGGRHPRELGESCRRDHGATLHARHAEAGDRGAQSAGWVRGRVESWGVDG